MNSLTERFAMATTVGNNGQKFIIKMQKIM